MYVRCSYCDALPRVHVSWLRCPTCNTLFPPGALATQAAKRTKPIVPATELPPAMYLREPSEEAFFSAHPGHPLGPGYPTGRTLRRDGETHRDAWKRILRDDPCAYCGGESTTIDHIVPARGTQRPGLGGLHSWTNYTGACERCNWSKADVPLIDWLLRRRVGSASRGARLTTGGGRRAPR